MLAVFIQKKSGFSSRKARYKRRSTCPQEIIDSFLNQMKEIMHHAELSNILNGDETFWRLVNPASFCWAERGASSISFNIDNCQKKGFSVMATIDAAGNKFPLFMIAKGSSKRVVSNWFGDSAPNIGTFSHSGWMNEQLMIQYLNVLRNWLDERGIKGHCYFLLDAYRAHIKEEVKAHAATIGITIVEIPPGMTDCFQPCDIKVFGALKSIGKRRWTRQYSKRQKSIGSGIEVPKAKMIDAYHELEQAWKSIGIDTIESAWSLYIEREYLSDE
jgi:hypothetical protein